MFENIPIPAFVAVGTIGAAIITGSIAFLSLLISKEQTVSGFRQAWIDSLRSELSDFLSAATTISGHMQLAKMNSKKEDFNFEAAMEPVHPHVTVAYAMYHRIVLRLNPDEHKDLRDLVTKAERALSDFGVISNAVAFSVLSEAVNCEAHKVLKKEWSTVKRGETVYWVVKVISAIAFTAAIIISGIVLYIYLHSA